MLATLSELLGQAQAGGWAVPAFNINNLEILKAVVQAAEEARAPVILQTSEGAIEYAGLQEIAALLQMAAVNAGVPVCVHLDHGKDLALIQKAMEYGYTSVMYDGSALAYEENVRNTKQVVGWAKKKGISVEAELGPIKGIEDLVSVEERNVIFTDPVEAHDFVEKTRCDALAVSIGTAHGAYKFKKEPLLDWDRLRAIQQKVDVPIVLHGASTIDPKTVSEIMRLGGEVKGARGLGDEALKKAVSMGVVKVNCDSDLRLAFVLGVRRILREQPKTIDPREIMRSAMDEIKIVALHKFRILGSYEKA